MNKVVLGLGFGDEGKGLTVDYLCSKSTNPLVVRFCGGHQVGHTVVVNGERHVFSNFGSGTLRGTPTFWSHPCTLDPIGLMNELDVLLKKDVEPCLYVHHDCPIVTPFDKAKNRKLEVANNHGSCGVGFGATIQREEDLYSLKFLDLFYKEIFHAKLYAISQYYKMDLDITDFIHACNRIVCYNNIKDGKEIVNKKDFSDYIYEGSQGIMLSQHIGFFPHVTRSNTDLTNVFNHINQDFEVYLVTRAYQTRHGNGPMTNEHLRHNIKKNPLETNIENLFQGKFRRALLDVSLLEYAIKKQTTLDFAKKVTLVITCLDHIENEYRFTYQGEIQNCLNENEFIKRVSSILKIKNVLISHGDDSEQIKEWKNE